MWYWTIPSGVITMVCLGLPHYIYAAGNYIECKGHVSHWICEFLKLIRLLLFWEEKLGVACVYSETLMD